MPIIQFHLDDRSPFTEDFIISKDATLPDLEVQLLDESAVVDLTGATIKFSMDDQLGVAKVNAVSAVLSDGPNGKFKYQWVAADTNTEGIFFGQFEVTAATKIYRIPDNEKQRLRIVVGPRIN